MQVVNFWPVFPLLFANGLGIYLTSFSLSVPLRPPCEAIQSPENTFPITQNRSAAGKAASRMGEGAQEAEPRRPRVGEGGVPGGALLLPAVGLHRWLFPGLIFLLVKKEFGFLVLLGLKVL